MLVNAAEDGVGLNQVAVSTFLESFWFSLQVFFNSFCQAAVHLYRYFKIHMQE